MSYTLKITAWQGFDAEPLRLTQYAIYKYLKRMDITSVMNTGRNQ